MTRFWRSDVHGRLLNISLGFESDDDKAEYLAKSFEEQFDSFVMGFL